jgi:hypothetical protein
MVTSNVPTDLKCRLSNHEQEISYNGIFEIDYNYVRNPRARTSTEIKDWLSFVNSPMRTDAG